MKKLLLLLLICVSMPGFTQTGGGPRGNMANMNIGHFYGKIIDDVTKNPVEFASVSVWQTKFDSASKTMKKTVAGGMLSESNGDFSIENLSLFGNYTLRISAIGYDTINMPVSFGITMKTPRESFMSAADKDLGNIRIKASRILRTVEIDGSDPYVEIKPDRRVYNVEKNDIVAGGTGEDVLKTVPGVNVDQDGNVTMRNAAPQIFVDGRPTTLTIDQIPADAIQSVEVITAPSAKYDASGGGGGIINVVLKKDRRFGYNGSVRAGIDMRSRVNAGVDLNLRQGKLNFFVSGNLNQRKSISDGVTDRTNYYDTPHTIVHQTDHQVNNNLFGMGRAGLDWFIDNRNTITLSGNYNTGRFDPLSDLNVQTDTQYTNIVSSYYNRHSESYREFHNTGLSLQFKHLFPKEGREWTADINSNFAGSTGGGDYSTQYTDAGGSPSQPELIQRTVSGGSTKFFTGQTDMTNPITDKIKLDYGIRAAIRNFVSEQDNYTKNTNTGTYDLQTNLTTHYSYLDAVYAGYVIYSQTINKWSFAPGLRIESSDYHGELTLTGQKYHNAFPLSLFPSASATFKASDKNDFQVMASRRINRPGFFQLMPFTDYSDSLNLSRGEPGLKPEFTYNAEVSWMHTFSRQTNFLVSAYARTTQGVITRYQITEYDTFLGRDAVINTYANANSSNVIGGEVSGKVAVKSWLEFNASFNVYNSVVNATNIESSLRNEVFSYNSRLSSTIRLPKNFTIQLSGDYQSKSAVVSSGGSRGGGGGMGMGGMGMGMFGGGSAATAQGYTLPIYGFDLSIKKDLFKNKTGSISLSANDLFKTRRNQSHSESTYFVQDVDRIRDQQFFRLNFSYRFGKFDVSLFKRKNNRVNTDGMDMM